MADQQNLPTQVSNPITEDASADDNPANGNEVHDATLSNQGSAAELDALLSYSVTFVRGLLLATMGTEADLSAGSTWQFKDAHTILRHKRKSAAQLWRMWRASEGQFWEDYLTPTFNSLTDVENAVLQHREEPRWEEFDANATMDVLHKAGTLWMKALVGFHVTATQSHGNRVKAACYTMLLELMKLLPNSATMKTDPTFVFQFLSKLASCTSDIIYLSRHSNATLTFEKLSNLPSRHKVIASIAARVGSRNQLLTSLDELQSTVAAEDQTCAICLCKWSTSTEDVEKMIETLEEGQSFQLVEWLSVSEDRRRLAVEAGFEGVPVKMQCGHVFCAGCIATWLDSTDTLLLCPFRDKVYGVHRGKAVMVIEEIWEEYASVLPTNVADHESDDAQADESIDRESIGTESGIVAPEESAECK